MLSAHEQGADPMSLTLEESARSVLASVLMDEREELTPELLESAIRSLRRRALKRQLDDLQHQLKEAERRQDGALASRLLQERLRLRRDHGCDRRAHRPVAPGSEAEQCEYDEPYCQVIDTKG